MGSYTLKKLRIKKKGGTKNYGQEVGIKTGYNIIVWCHLKLTFAMSFSCTAKKWWYLYHCRNEFLKTSILDILVYLEWKA